MSLPAVAWLERDYDDPSWWWRMEDRAIYESEQEVQPMFTFKYDDDVGCERDTYCICITPDYRQDWREERTVSEAELKRWMEHGGPHLHSTRKGTVPDEHTALRDDVAFRNEPLPEAATAALARLASARLVVSLGDVERLM